MPSRILQKYPTQKLFGLRVFLISIITATALFLPFIIMGGGVFYYYGDFNVQEIPFYQLVHDAVRNGDMGWMHNVDLGTDMLSSFSFYLLGSPFFWLTIPFPSEAVPYLIGPLLILKFGCASLSAYLYLKRYVTDRNFALVGGLLYAFSGFSIYNVFFFHFHEPMIMFPLLLAALDAFIYDGKRIVFTLAVFSACVVNYYFFVGQVLFVIIYFLMITLTKTYKFKVKNFLLLALEVIIGFLATAFILLPSVLGLMGNPRLAELPNGWDSLVYSQPQKYWLIILSLFFPADMPAFPVFTPGSNCRWASVAAWLPLVGMTGVIAYFQVCRKSWLKKLLAVLAVFACVPVLNSMFQLMNSSIYYARWFYMGVLMLALATIKAFENRKTDWNRAIRWSAGITVGATLLIGLMPVNYTDEESGDIQNTVIGTQATFERYWLYVLMALLSLLAFVLIIKKFRRNKKKFTVMLTVGILSVSLFTSYFIIATGYFSSSSTNIIKEDIINRRDGITIADIDNVRSDFYECVDNTAMFWQIQSINCFQSSVSTSIMQFYDALGITRDVASRPDLDVYGLRPFLSCKYLFDYRGDGKSGSLNSFVDENGNTRMPGWKYLRTQNRFDIYRNEYYIPMGYTFDKFIAEEEFDLVTNAHKSEALLYAMVLPRDLMKKYSDITGYSDEKYKLLYGKHPEDYDSITEKFDYSNSDYKKVCNLRALNSCTSFEYTDNGFKAVYNNKKGDDNLLFFSVPYSDGFTATVNGKATDVEKVDYGFMAVKIPKGEKCDIVFTYETPGFSTGVKISLCAFGAFLIYCAVIVTVKTVKKRKNKN